MDQRSNIAILGFGATGRAVFEYLRMHEYPDLTVCDQNVDLEDEMPDGVSVRIGEHYLRDLTDFDVIFRSPGIRYLAPEIQVAVQKGVEVTSGVKYFMDQCPCPVIGVTGTKGKGTTSTLIFEMLKKAGQDVYLGGNIGEPPVKFLDKLKNDSIVVLEFSSFQLQDLEKSPHYAVFLNTTSDHLDYHVDRDEYMKAKESIIVHQTKDGVTVLNKDYDYTNYYEPLVKGELRELSVKGEVKEGAYRKGDALFYSKKGDSKEIVKVSDIKLIGAHNIENVLPAIVIAMELNVDSDDVEDVIKSFEGLPHRLEFAGEVNGVQYYNDSFSTTQETSMAAVDSFDEPTVLIAGGYDKKLDYKEWALKILTKPNLHAVILIGEIAGQMEEELRQAEKELGEAEGSATKILRRKNLKEAVEAAADEAKDGGVVVMSPASASFDMFNSYKERGKMFMAEVKELKINSI